MKKKTRQQLVREFNRVRAQIDAIDEAADRKKNAVLVGQCFKYHNSYGSGEKWWLYVQVVSIDCRWVKVNSFQDDGQGRIEFEYQRTHMGTQFTNGGYQRIPFGEFYAAYGAALSALPKPDAAIAK